jgi:hypothetical protein
MAGAQLICVQEFQAWGKKYNVDDVVLPEDYAGWPEEALANRLKNKFVKYKATKIQAPEAHAAGATGRRNAPPAAGANT